MSKEQDMTKKDKPISEKQKMFVRAIVCDGLKQGEAYKKYFGSVKFPDSRASYLLKKASILKYYNELSAEMDKRAVERGVWSREIATRLLCSLMEEANKEVNRTGIITRAYVMAILKSIRELNKMYGIGKSKKERPCGKVIFLD